MCREMKREHAKIMKRNFGGKKEHMDAIERNKKKYKAIATSKDILDRKDLSNELKDEIISKLFRHFGVNQYDIECYEAYVWHTNRTKGV